MKYKMIACDLDGTLLDKNGDLSDENLKAIKELIARGVIFVPTTGRAYYEVPSTLRNFEGIKYFISSDGAVINNFVTGERFEYLLDGEKVKEIYSIFKNYNFIGINHKSDESIIDINSMNNETLQKYKISSYFINQLEKYVKKIDNFEEDLLSGEPCEMVCGCFSCRDELKKCMKSIKAISNIRYATSAVGTLEVVAFDAGKRNGVEFLMKKIGLTANEVITVGDSGNDMDMIKLVPNSVAVANASDDLKAKAGYIGCSNSEHIAKYLLENFFND